MIDEKINSNFRKPLGWLIRCSRSARQWIVLSIALGISSGLLLILQARCVARIIHSTVMEGLHRNDQWFTFIAILALVGTRAMLAWGRELAGFKAGTAVREEVRSALVRHITKRGPEFTGRHKTGALTSVAMEQVEGLHGFFAHYLPQLALSVAIPAAMLAFIFPISWAAGGLLLVAAPLIPLFMILVGMGAESISQRNFQALARMSAHFLDVLQGLSTLKLLNRSRKEEANIKRVSDGYRRKTMSVLRVAFLSSAVLEFFSSISIALVAVYLGLSYLGYVAFGAWDKPLTLAGGFFILLLAPELFLPLRELGTHYHSRAEALGASSEILKILTDDDQEPTGRTNLFVPDKALAIRCKDLHLTYAGSGRKVLCGVSFDLSAGEQVALVGASGTGKTSIVNLLLGFIPVDKGQIFVNHAPLDSVSKESWRRHLTWIGQRPVLLAGTIRENILMGGPEATESDIDAAVSAAGASEFIAKLPHGLETQVGERGQGLSRGQAQRVALARAFIKDARLLLLDEPTAGLDVETENRVMASIRDRFRNRSVLLLTHRLTGLQKMDRILVMADGRIVQAGTWFELKQVEGEFRRLLTRGQEESPYA